jgi:hypothetical protein
MVRMAMRVLMLVASLQPAHAAECLHDRIRYEPRSFLGYACEDDCQRHKAGFAWAEQRGLTDPAGCRGLGPAESEGCRAWVDDGIVAEEAGYRWALENEVGEPCLCDGAGSRFRAGCLRYQAPPGHAQSWPGRAETFSRAPGGR